MANSKNQKAKLVIMKVAKINRVKLSEGLLKAFPGERENQVITLLKTPKTY